MYVTYTTLRYEMCFSRYIRLLTCQLSKRSYYTDVNLCHQKNHTTNNISLLRGENIKLLALRSKIEMLKKFSSRQIKRSI